MLLHFIFISVVVCTAEISEFHSVLSPLLENLSAVSLDACDNYAPNFEKVDGAYCFWSVR